MAALLREAVQGMALLTFDSSARVPADSPVREAVKDVAVSGRFVHQWELLREAIAALAAECLRLCEVVSARGGGVYKSRPKLAYALHRLASVTSTLQPVAVEDRWAQGSGGGLGGEGSDMAGALRLRRPLGEDTDEQADGSELSAAAAPAAGARTVSAKRPREGDDADGADPAAATDDGGRDGEAEPAASAQSGEAAGASRAGAAGPDSEQGPAKRPRPSQ
ncbi:hypothetical protein FNF29_04461 [Cafeteria roenbergensis]|uniref:Uncharacterized protein n=1 Tax=Cafeteria roenbergensis TaxID=33653 RepID=A0A5A8CG17_CAFRO|nr:hypothetical protein FNF29_04461 [Cafeteria roenbergensis]KAA0161411.1 hypothetical protein FNF31_03870 [Cafeteria roenbergensis]KAA0162399.1 hypothetical protein FNF28_04737 [Cafeteria roenbergensis]|eukprot:KAA0151537.1 hypothetical protein FNF29_04461 [Cafeteria roenbergensis]